MCPFCIGTAVWIAAGAVTTAGASTLAITKFIHKKSRPSAEGGSNEN